MLREIRNLVLWILAGMVVVAAMFGVVFLLFALVAKTPVLFLLLLFVVMSWSVGNHFLQSK